MKTGFYFMLKAVFVVNIITSCPDFSVMLIEKLVKKAMVKFKMTSLNSNTQIAQ